MSRISVYFTKCSKVGIEENAPVLLEAVGAAFIGVLAGKTIEKDNHRLCLNYCNRYDYVNSYSWGAYDKL